MTRADTWKKRPCVVKYWAYKDELRRLIKKNNIEIDKEIYVEFYIPMPKSWSKKKKDLLNNKPHEKRPDIDNLVKGVMDALFKEDSHVHTVYAKKIWSYNPGITFITLKDLHEYLI
jgi:Holliday junction resolvase RusA-like endonuclease